MTTTPSNQFEKPEQAEFGGRNSLRARNFLLRVELLVRSSLYA